MARRWGMMVWAVTVNHQQYMLTDSARGQALAIQRLETHVEWMAEGRAQQGPWMPWRDPFDPLGTRACPASGPFNPPEERARILKRKTCSAHGHHPRTKACPKTQLQTPRQPTTSHRGFEKEATHVSQIDHCFDPKSHHQISPCWKSCKSAKIRVLNTYIMIPKIHIMHRRLSTQYGWSNMNESPSPALRFEGQGGARGGGGSPTLRPHVSHRLLPPPQPAWPAWPHSPGYRLHQPSGHYVSPHGCLSTRIVTK